MNRSLAKVLGPALLLTATLALPAESFGAPSPEPKASAMDRDDKKNKNQKNANKAQQNRGQERRAQAQQRNAVRKGAQQQAKAQKQVQQRQEVRRQAQIQAQQRAQWQRQEAHRQAQIRAQQQTQWQRQQAHQLQLRRQEEARRQAQLRQRDARYYPRNNRQPYRYNDQYARYQRSGERFHIDGFVVDEGGHCSLLRDHQGHVFALVGNIGDIVQGDHLRLQGRVVDGGLCDWRGTAFEVIQVKTLWDNNRHDTASYDYQRDRYSFEEFLDNRY
jgi:flagellar biosynthesis GTPase FlhF